MSGQLQRVKSAKEPKAPHTHAVFTFTQGGQLRFVDPRTFGELFVSPPPSADAPPRSLPSGPPFSARHAQGAARAAISVSTRSRT